MFDDSIMIGIGNRSAVYTSKIMKITAIVTRSLVARNFLGRTHILMVIFFLGPHLFSLRLVLLIL